MFFKWRSRIKIKGLNQERILNKIIKKVKIYNFKRESYNVSCFEVDYRKRRIARKILKEERLEVLSQSHYGVSAFFRKAVKNYGIIVGVILCIFCYAVQFNFIYKVHAFGDSMVQDQVEHFVENSLRSRLKRNIDTKEIERQIRGNLAR